MPAYAPFDKVQVNEMDGFAVTEMAEDHPDEEVADKERAPPFDLGNCINLSLNDSRVPANLA